jgi:hypothetical protein
VDSDRNAKALRMQELNVSDGFLVSSYEKDGKFVLLFASPASTDPITDPETIALVMAPETLNALADYLQDND